MDGIKEGFGNLKISNNNNNNNNNNTEYEGYFHNDLKEGYGIQRWENGNVYKGYFKNDEREGMGEMKWSDDAIYIGQWKKGTKHGIGKMKLKDGKTQEGKFRHNIYFGPAPYSKYPPELLISNFKIEMIRPRFFGGLKRKAISPLKKSFLPIQKNSRKYNFLKTSESNSNLNHFHKNKLYQNGLSKTKMDGFSNQKIISSKKSLGITPTKIKLSMLNKDLNFSQNLYNIKVSPRLMKYQPIPQNKIWVPSGPIRSFH